MKKFSCRDAGMNCDWKTTGNSDEDILKSAQEHGRSSHGLKDLTEELRATIKSKIEEIKR